MRVARARYQCWISWQAYNLGLLTFDSSLFDGADVFAVSPLDATFQGTYDDVSARLRRASWSRGRSNNRDTVLAGEATLELRDPTGIFNPDNPASPLYGQLEDRLHPVKFQAVADLVAKAALTVSGNEITDASRALLVQGDGRTSDSSFGVWEATTNRVLNGNAATNTTGATVLGGGVVTISRSTTLFKFGSTSFRVATDGLGANQGAAFETAAGLAAAPGAVYTGRVWLYATGADVGKTLRVFTRITNTDATTTDSADTNVTLVSGWQEVKAATATVLAGKTGDRAFVCVRTLLGVSLAFTVNAGGCSVENQPLATPYVHTDGATATRAAARVQAPASLIDETQGWVAMRVRMGWGNSGEPGGGTGFLFPFDWRDSGNERLGIYYRESTNAWAMRRLTAGAGTDATSAADTIVAGDFVTLIGAWTATQTKISVDGGAFTVAANTTIPTLAASLFDIGSNGGEHIDSDVLWFACGTGTLTNADAATLHGQGNIDPALYDLRQLLPAASVTAAWAAKTSSYDYPLLNQTLPLFYGWTHRFKWEPQGRRGITSVECVDLFYWLKRVKPTIAATGATTTGAAIGKILDAAGLTDPALRDLNTGDTIPDFSADGTKDGLTLIEDLLESERGVFFVAGSGKATFRSRLARLSMDSVATINDRMTALAPGVDFESAYTRVTVKRTQNAFTAVATSDAVTIQRLGYVDFPTIETAYLSTDAQATDLAAHVLAQLETPRPPIYGFQLDNRESDLLTHVLARELVDRFTTSEAVGGTAGDFHIDRMQHTLERRRHSVNWLLSRASGAAPLEFDKSTFSGADVFVY